MPALGRPSGRWHRVRGRFCAAAALVALRWRRSWFKAAPYLDRRRAIRPPGFLVSESLGSAACAALSSPRRHHATRPTVPSRMSSPPRTNQAARATTRAKTRASRAQPRSSSAARASSWASPRMLRPRRSGCRCLPRGAPRPSGLSHLRLASTRRHTLTSCRPRGRWRARACRSPPPTRPLRPRSRGCPWPPPLQCRPSRC